MAIGSEGPAVGDFTVPKSINLSIELVVVLGGREVLCHGQHELSDCNGPGGAGPLGFARLRPF